MSVCGAIVIITGGIGFNTMLVTVNVKHIYRKTVGVILLGHSL